MVKIMHTIGEKIMEKKEVWIQVKEEKQRENREKFNEERNREFKIRKAALPLIMLA